MRRAIILPLSAVFFYGILREINTVGILLIFSGLASIYGIYRLPAKYLAALKYPVILLALASSAGFLVYPKITIPHGVKAIVAFFSFYSIALYLVTVDEKQKGIYKEVIALTILFLSSSFNLSMTGKPVLIFPLAIALISYLFITGRNIIIPFIAGYALVIGVLVYRKGFFLFGKEMMLSDMNRYLILVAALLLLVFCLVDFVKKTNFPKLFAFFGILILSFDILLSVGLKLSGCLLHQPVLALAVMTPFLGSMMKDERGKL